MKMNDNQHFYSEKSDGSSTSHVQIDVDKIKTSIETKFPICQDHQDILGLTDAFELHIKEDILLLKDKSSHNYVRFPKDAFKINYCQFCGRRLNKE
ncbi:hypothetical protein DQM14_00520 [Limosilactobacillus fermentum]|uniref:hypothetical protein n=1 Tax=Limosilactobacillus fermentum TaxID=1613 RepID=UPI000E095E40|nr:hypothetical protein [Limosilactobacillus fermentum]RDG21425.1 hypothetical protein DQM14_00520 [Limosilactobacillus fermentum]